MDKLNYKVTGSFVKEAFQSVGAFHELDQMAKQGEKPFYMVSNFDVDKDFHNSIIGFHLTKCVQTGGSRKNNRTAKLKIQSLSSDKVIEFVIDPELVHEIVMELKSSPDFTGLKLEGLVEGVAARIKAVLEN